MDWSELFQKSQKWLAFGTVVLVAAGAAYRFARTRPDNPGTGIDEAITSAAAASSSAAVVDPFPGTPSQIPREAQAPSPPPQTAHEAKEPPKRQPDSIGSVAASQHPKIEVPKLTQMAQRQIPRMEDLASAPHVPTYPTHRLTYDGPAGPKPTAEEAAKAIHTAVVVNLMASLKMALLRADETTARAIIGNLRFYGKLAERGLEVEELNTNGELSDAFRQIREQLRR